MPCFSMFCSSFCSVLMLGLHTHMLDFMSMVMSCLDLRVCMHILCSYAYIRVFTCLYTWIHVLPCLCAKFLHVYTYVPVPICLYLCFHMLVCLDLCFLCLDLSYVCHAMRYCSPLSLCLCLLCFGLLVWT